MAVISMIQTFRFRLKDKHSAELNRQAHQVNFVWNYLNESQMRLWREKRKYFSYSTFCRMTAGSSTHVGLHAHTIQKICFQYEMSRRQHKKRWLKFRGKKSLGWVPFNQGCVKIDHIKKQFTFRGVTYSPMHWREMPKDKIPRVGCFGRDRLGRWYINIPFDVSDEICSQAPKNAVGIDLGLMDFAALSTGKKIKSARYFRAEEFRIKNAQRARKYKLMRKLSLRITNKRKDFLHKLSAQIAISNDMIFVGDVSSEKLARTHLSKSIADSGWSTFRRMLSYKAIRHGGVMVEVDERMTSQTCSCCGALPDERPAGIAGLGIREWTCGGCGASHDRDVNAARNILARGLASLEEGAAQMRSSQYNHEFRDCVRMPTSLT